MLRDKKQCLLLRPLWTRSRFLRVLNDGNKLVNKVYYNFEKNIQKHLQETKKVLPLQPR